MHDAQYKGRGVAAKRFYCDEITWEELRAICHEMIVTWHVQSKHVVEFYGYCVQPPFIFVVMEKCSQGDLLTAIETGQHSMEVRYQFARECVECVAFINGQSFLHCDIKSLNFLVTDEEGALVCKLADFGEAVKEHRRDDDPTVVGTYEWMAPEVMQGGRYTKAADLYSIAVVVWECLSGQSPYADEQGGMNGIREKVLKGARPNWKGTILEGDGAVRIAVCKAWSQDPIDRGTLEELLAALRAERDRPRGAGAGE